MKTLAKLQRLERDTDCNSRGSGIPAVVQVIAIVVVVDVNVIGVVPVIRPVFRPWVNRTDPIATVLKPWVSANNLEGKAVDSEPMLRTKVSPEPIVRDVVAAIAPTLFPGTMVGFPAPCAMLSPCARLTLFLRASRSIIAPLLLGVLRLLPLSVWLLLLPAVLWLFVPVLALLLLSAFWLPASVWLLLPGVLRLFVPALALLSRLAPALFLFGMPLFFARLLLPRIGRSSESENQRQNGGAGDPGCFHGCCLCHCSLPARLL